MLKITLNALYHEDFALKKWILSVVAFIVSFVFFSFLVFELAFRFLDSDSVINFMSRMGFLGFKPSFDSWFVFLIFISFFCAFVFSCVLHLKINRGKK